MKPPSRFALALCMPLVMATAAVAQVETPRVSPGATVSQKVGTTDVTVRYHRPAVKGRAIWGAVVPFDQVWRLGANDATVLELADDCRVAGHPVPAGRYALFAIPGRAEWTLILNRRADQWGAYAYAQEQDLLRFTVQPGAAAATEWLTFDITPTGPGSAEVAMRWAELRVAFPVEVDVEAIVWRDLDAALAAQPGADVLLQATRYALDTGRRLDEARGWIDASLAADPRSFWGHEAKADLLHRTGHAAEAVPLLERALELSRGRTPAGYQQGLEEKLARYRAAAGG